MTEILVPDAAIVEACERSAAEEEHPSANPFAVYEESALSSRVCDDIVKAGLALPRDHDLEHCGAEVRPMPLSEIPHARVVLTHFDSHREWWDFHIDVMTFAFMTYKDGGEYAWHVDIAPGVSRKVSTSVLLSDGYEGGDLVIRTIKDFTMPKTKGTIVTFPAYMLHTVTPVTSGVRYSLVIATWGEPFR